MVQGNDASLHNSLWPLLPSLLPLSFHLSKFFIQDSVLPAKVLFLMCASFCLHLLCQRPRRDSSAINEEPLIGHVNLSCLCLQHMASVFLSWLELTSSEISATQQAAGISCSPLQISWMFPVFAPLPQSLSGVQSEREGPIDVAEIPVWSLTRNTSDLMFVVNTLVWLCLIVVWLILSMFVTNLAGNRIPFIFATPSCEVTI